MKLYEFRDLFSYATEQGENVMSCKEFAMFVHSLAEL